MNDINTTQDLLEKIQKSALLLRRSLLFRFNWQRLPAKCLLIKENDAKTNLFEFSIPENYELNKRAKWILPIFLKFQEFNMIEILTSLEKKEDLDNDDENEKFLNSAWDNFVDYNYGWRSSEWRPGKYFKFEGIEKSKIQGNLFSRLRYIRIKDEDNQLHLESSGSSILVGIANWKVRDRDLNEVLHGKKHLSSYQRDELYKIINEAVARNVSLLIFPELALPLDLIPVLARKCSDSGMAIVTGVEYYLSKSKNVYNLTATILPMSGNHNKSAIIIPRIKNYYSPQEIDNILNHHLTPYFVRKPYYDLIHWNNRYFSVYNCFELSNINDRALLKSKVDFLIAVEFNRDTNYYSNIVGSWARDLHCYVIQVNTSQYGDSRITAPQKTEESNLLQIKGGKYPVLLVEKIDIESLRDFQFHKYSGHLHNGDFKPLPANFDRKWLEKRINNEPIVD